MNENQPPTKRWVRVTCTEAIPLREGRAVQIAGHEVAIFNLGSHFLAIENKCPHRGGPLADGIVSGGTVVCPLHAWKIDLSTGKTINQPSAPPCVKTFATQVENGVLSLEIPVAASATIHFPQDCLATISQGPYLTRSASSEV